MESRNYLPTPSCQTFWEFSETLNLLQQQNGNHPYRKLHGEFFKTKAENRVPLEVDDDFHTLNSFPTPFSDFIDSFPQKTPDWNKSRNSYQKSKSAHQNCHLMHQISLLWSFSPLSKILFAYASHPECFRKFRERQLQVKCAHCCSSKSFRNPKTMAQCVKRVWRNWTDSRLSFRSALS